MLAMEEGLPGSESLPVGVEIDGVYHEVPPEVPSRPRSRKLGEFVASDERDIIPDSAFALRPCLSGRIRRKFTPAKSRSREQLLFSYSPETSRKFIEEAPAALIKGLSKSELTRQELIFQFAAEEPLYLADLNLTLDVGASSFLSSWTWSNVLIE